MGRFAKPQVTIDLAEYQELKDYKRIVSSELLKDTMLELGRHIYQSGNTSVIRQFTEILKKYDLMFVEYRSSGGADVTYEIVAQNRPRT